MIANLLKIPLHFFELDLLPFHLGRPHPRQGILLFMLQRLQLLHCHAIELQPPTFVDALSSLILDVPQLALQLCIVFSCLPELLLGGYVVVVRALSPLDQILLLLLLRHQALHQLCIELLLDSQFFFELSPQSPFGRQLHVEMPHLSF